MSIVSHALKQPFVLATGVAALVHSTWALGTLFSGPQPDDVAHLVGWLVPAFLIAFALDVGQIITSAEIRASGLTWQRSVTFTTFAGATYYLQWLYIAHHMPALTLAAGVRPEWAGLTGLIRDAALWAIPALLPLSTLLYTLSSNERPAATPEPTQAAAPPVVLSDNQQLKPITSPAPAKTLPPPPVEAADQVEDDIDWWYVDQMLERQRDQAAAEQAEQYPAVCETCGKQIGVYDNAASAAAALRGHRRHCAPLKVVSNGVEHHE